MAITKPTVRPAWADSATTPDIKDPGVSATASGWLASAVPPSRQIFNWILNYCMNGIRYFSRRGVVDYDPQETYLVGDIARGDDNIVRQSLISANKGNTPSSSPVAWGPLTGYTTPASLATALQPYATPGNIQSSIVALKFIYHDAITYHKIATLPATTVGTVDSIQIRASINSNYDSAQTAMCDLIMGNRNQFKCWWNAFGPISANGCIQCFRESDGTVSVYSVGQAFSYNYLSIINVGGADGNVGAGPTPIIYPNPVGTIVAPTGVLVFTTNRPDLYPPLIYASSASTYINSNQIAATYETIAQANANLITAENFATSQANQAFVNGQNYSNAVGANSTATSEGFASAVASTAQANAKAYTDSILLSAQLYANNAAASALNQAEVYANGSSSLAAIGWSRDPSGKLTQWGTFVGGVNARNVNFPTPFSQVFIFHAIGNTSSSQGIPICGTQVLNGNTGTIYSSTTASGTWYAIGV